VHIQLSLHQLILLTSFLACNCQGATGWANQSITDGNQELVDDVNLTDVRVDYVVHVMLAACSLFMHWIEHSSMHSPSGIGMPNDLKTFFRWFGCRLA
jgi:hypothetical protein